MDTLGSEVGTKMMSAVKAKLIELGSGGSSGYIDDELPDYVMIMVANKRSKQQMIEDLNLFLGSNTEPFVNWLHQVLQKLQEVTLSATAAAAAATSAASLTTKTKRKLSESTDKKDKKEKKKKMKRSLKEKSQERTSSATVAASTSSSSSSSSISTASTTAIVPNQIGVGMTSIATAAATTTTTTPSSNTVIQSTKTTKTTTTTTNPTVIIPSITDVFAEHFIQRAKETIRIESSLSSKVKNEEKLVRASIGSTTPPPASAPTTTTTPQSISSTTTTNTTIISSALDDKQQKNQSLNESAPTTDILSSSTSTTATTINPVKIDDGFDIPTISEISKNQSVTGKYPIGSHKEVVELAELQKIIYQAKRQLKSKGLVDDDDFEYNDDDDDEEDNDDYDYNDDDRNRNRNDRFGEGCSAINQNVNAAESEDEDFINLKADGEELDDDNLSGLMDMDKQQYSIGGTQKAKITTTTTTTTIPKQIGGITHRSNKSNKTKNEFNPIQSGHESDTKNNRYKKNNRSHISYEEEMDRELLRRTTVVNTIKDNEKIITKKPSIMDRLGVRPTTSSTTQTNSNNIISLSAHRRTENEMYTSAAAAVAAAVSSSYRRQRDDVNESERFTSRNTGDNPNKIRIPITERLSKPLITISNSLPSSSSSSSSSLNDKRGSLNKEIYRTTSPTIMTTQSSSSSSKTELSDTLKSRIGSRVIKAPPKPQYDEDYIEVPINSVVKIQPRPKIPSNKQACTHLLLRAVAEAQKSTAFIKPKPDLRTTVSTTSTPAATLTSTSTTPTKTQSSSSSASSSSSSGSRSTKLINDKPDLFTKTYRDNNNLMLKSRSKQKDSIVIQIPGDTTINYNNNNVDDDDDENNHQHHSHHSHHHHHIRINNDGDNEDDDDDDDIIVTEIDDEMVVHRIEDDDDEEHDDHVTNMEPESIEHDEEYIPEVVTSQRHITSQSTEEHEGNYVYIPVNINNVSGGNSAASVAAASAAAVAAGSDDDLIKSDSPLKNTDDIYDTKTQFVVTLDGAANFNNKSNDDQNLLKIIQSDRIKSDESKIKHKHHHHHHHHHNHNQHQQQQQHSHQSLSSSSSADRQDKDEHQNSQKIIITKTVTNDRIEDNNNNNNNKLHKLNKADLNHDKIIINNNNNNNIAIEESNVNDDYDDENVNELRKIVERSSKKNRESKKLESKLNKNLKRSRVSPIKFDLYSPSSSKTTTGSSSTTTISRNNLNENHKLRSSNATISITSSKYHSNESQPQPIKKPKIHNQTENDLKKMIHHSKYENSNNININIIDSDIDNYSNNNNKEEQFNSDNIQIELPKENRRVKIMKSGETNRKYENIPSLSSAIISGSSIVLSSSSSGTGETGGIGHKLKSKSRCTYFPICGKGDNCEFMHPTQQLCKTFPNCTFGDKCLYIHPKCKFDLTCNRLNCNFYHSIIPTTVTMMTTGGISSVAAPLSSHVVPVSNYKTITATTVLPALCRFFPNCTNTLCTFYHPKPCHFGKFCNNKMECQFYHFDLPPRKDKLKWVAATTNPQSSSSSSSSTFGSMNITSSIIPQSSTTAIN